MLKVRNLHKAYGENEVLKGIDLDVSKGSVTAVLGPSGSGKSTLLRCLNLLERPQAGTIKVGDMDIDCRKARKNEILELRRKTAMVFQDYNLFSHKTALQNVSEGLITVRRMSKSDAEEEAVRNLEKVGLIDRAGYFPAQLSGGQQQRVAIARALAMKPDVILFDEPTSALDPELVQEVLGVMKTVAMEGMTMIVVTHELGFARGVATDALLMDHGVIIERAPSETFFKNPREMRTKQFLRQISAEYDYAI